MVTVILEWDHSIGSHFIGFALNTLLAGSFPKPGHGG